MAKDILKDNDVALAHLARLVSMEDYGTLADYVRCAQQLMELQAAGCDGPVDLATYLAEIIGELGIDPATVDPAEN